MTVQPVLVYERPTRPEPRRDYLGRYLIPDPVTGKDRAWTRATTWAKSIADIYHLSQWGERQVALGLALRPDLLAHVAALAALDPDESGNKKKLQKLCEQAKEYSKSKVGANVGNALHGFTEAHDTGRRIEHIPEPWDKDLAAYQRGMRGVEVSRNYIEKIGLVHDLGVAGTMDRVVRFKHRSLPLIGDLKTTQEIKYSWTEIVIQLALYAHSDTVYDPLEDEHRPMLKVNQEQALVIWLPAGQGRCRLFLADIGAGWEMAITCGQVRHWRSRKDLAQLLVEAEA